MNKISLVIDVKKISKDKLVERTYTNREGEVVTVKELKAEVIPLKEVKVVTKGDTWKMVKVGFIVEQATKEEKANKTKTPAIGDAFEFRDRKQEEIDTGDEEKAVLDGGVEDDEIPF